MEVLRLKVDEDVNDDDEDDTDDDEEDSLFLEEAPKDIIEEGLEFLAVPLLPATGKAVLTTLLLQ